MEPNFNDYVALIYNRFDAFVQVSYTIGKVGRPLVYQQQGMIGFFMWMQFRRIYPFKTQWRWLKGQPEAGQLLGWACVPDRPPLSRRYQALYPCLQEFRHFRAQASAALGDELSTTHRYEDKRLFKAQGAVWHQSDRPAGRIPDQPRHLDTDASWSKRAYQGWVYGYGLHLTCNPAGFPIFIAVETAAFSEKDALAGKEVVILNDRRPETLSGDDAYTAANRIRAWARQGVAVLTPPFVGATGVMPRLTIPAWSNPTALPCCASAKRPLNPSLIGWRSDWAQLESTNSLPFSRFPTSVLVSGWRSSPFNLP